MTIRFRYYWEDDGCANIKTIDCDCGYHEDNVDEMITAEETYTCPQCGATHTFRWGGMM